MREQNIPIWGIVVMFLASLLGVILLGQQIYWYMNSAGGMRA